MKYGEFILAGSTGSIGRQALEVALHCGIRTEAITSFGNNLPVAEEQIRRFRPKYCFIRDKKAASALKKAVSDTETKILTGNDGMEELFSSAKSRIVLNAVVGNEGLETSVFAIKSGKDLALANKETLVIGGKLVTDLAKKNAVRIYPVDSEHCAISQCIGKEKNDKIGKIILTASGGPFFGYSKSKLKKVTPEETLSHPTWKMGKRITVDSATLLNKGFEWIEAVRLFNVSPDQVGVVIHRESVLHSAVEFIDHTVIGQMSVPDMRSCIQYALTGNIRRPSLLPSLDLTSLGKLTFYKPDTDVFPLLKLAKNALDRGGLIPAVLNKADEAAVSLFLDHKITFWEIGELIEEVVKNFPDMPLNDFSDIPFAEKKAEKMILDLAR